MNACTRRVTAALGLCLSLSAQRFAPTDQTPITGFLPLLGSRTFATDVDADGDVDLVVGGASIAINDGRHGFSVTRPGLRIPTQTFGFPYSLQAAADVDGSGTEDLLTTRIDLFASSTSLLVMPATGTGAFGILIGSSPVPGILQVALVRDVDGDNLPDVFLIGFPGVALLRNAGNANFVDVTAVKLPPALQAAQHLPLDTADIDGDGDADLLTGGHSTPLQLWRNDGTGAFTADAANDLTPYGSTLRAEFVDLDFDFVVDLVLFDDATRTLRILRNTAGVFAPSLLGLPSTGTVHEMAVSDLNGDFAPDLLLLTGSSHELSLTACIHQGIGFAALPDVRTGLTVLQLPLDVSAVDLDGDGDRDAALGDRSLFVNDGGGGMQPLVVRSTPQLVVATTVHAGDLDGDGDLDLAAGRHVLRGTGDGRFVDSGFALPDDGVVRAMFDADGDGDLDFVWTAADNTLLDPFACGLVLAHGGVLTQAPFPLRAMSGRVVANDLDGDGRIDLVAEDGTVLRNLGGSFVVARTIAVAGPGPVAVLDFDGDARPDLVFGQDTLRNLGGLNFAPAGQLPLGPLPVLRDLKTADLDQDGDLDLAAAITTSSFGGVFDVTVPLLRQSGNWIAGQQLLTTSSNGGSRIELADVDGDGLVDVIDSAVWKNLGGASFTRIEGLPFATALDCEAADVDGDADVDLLIAYGDEVLVLANRRQQVRSPRVPVLGDPYEVEFAVDGGSGGLGGVVLPLLALQRIPPFLLPGLGVLHVDPQTAFVGSVLATGVGGTATLAFSVPNDPVLGGVEFTWQALVQRGNSLRLTGRWDERVVR